MENLYDIELLEIKKAEGKLQSKVKKLHKASSAIVILNISKITDVVNNYSKAKEVKPPLLFPVTDLG
jgi:hypothetical protein